MTLSDLLGQPVEDTFDPQRRAPTSCSSQPVPAPLSPQPTRPNRKWFAAALVVVLALGGLGGWMAARGTLNPVTAVEARPLDSMPADVAATAELFAHLYFGENTSDTDIEGIYLGTLPAQTGVWVNDTAAVSGARTREAVWSVTVAVDALESVEGEYQPVGLRYYSITIATDGKEPVVTSAPTRIPAPPRPGLLAAAPAPVPDDQVEITVRFLEQYLTGGANLPRYMATTNSIDTFREPPYETAAANPIGTDDLGRIVASVQATTRLGATHHLEYLLTPVFENGVWVIADLGAG